MVNRYDKPAQAQFINAYAPIDFDALYRIGSANKEAVDKVEKELSAQIKEWGQFKSPSQVDTKRFYDLTLSRIAPIVEEIAKNPDMLKSAQGRAQIQSVINNTDYATLSELKEGADALRLFQRNQAELMSRGLWNPSRNWNNVDVSNYDTKSSGVLKQISPLQYKSLGEVVRPYIEGLKPSFIAGNVNPNDPSQKLPFTKGWMAITNEDLQRTLIEKANEIVQTPQGRAWYNDIADTMRTINPKATKEDIYNAFVDQMMQDSQYKLTATPVDDALAMQKEVARYKYRLEHPEDAQVPMTRSEEFMASLEQKQKSALSSYSNKRYGKKYDELDENQKYAVITELIQDYQKDPSKMNVLQESLTPSEYFMYFDQDKMNRRVFTNKKGEEVKHPDMEAYKQRNGDVVYTVDGYVANDVPRAFISSVSTVNMPTTGGGYQLQAGKATVKEIDMNEAMYKIQNVLNYIESGAFEPSGKVQLSSDRDMKAKGYLYVSEDDLEKAFEMAYPEDASDLFELYTKGYRETPNSRKVHKIAEKVEGDNKYLNGDNNIYRIEIGRSLYGDFAQTSMSNLFYSNKQAGASYNKERMQQIQGQSWLDSQSVNRGR